MVSKETDAPVSKRHSGSSAAIQALRDLAAHGRRGSGHDSEPELPIHWGRLARRLAKVGATAVAGIIAGALGVSAIDPGQPDPVQPSEIAIRPGLTMETPPGDEVSLRCDPTLLAYLEHVSTVGPDLADALEGGDLAAAAAATRRLTKVDALNPDVRLCLIHRELAREKNP